MPEGASCIRRPSRARAWLVAALPQASQGAPRPAPIPEGGRTGLPPIPAVLLLCACVGLAWGVPVELKIEEQAGVARVQELVTSGVPLPRAAGIADPGQLSIAGTPAQFRVLSRWDGTPQDTSKPIKWVLCDFQADVPANGTVRYTLQTGGNPSPPQAIQVQERTDALGSYYEVHTGPAVFHVRKSGERGWNLFDRVVVSGRELISPSGAHGVVIETDKTTQLARTYTASPPPPPPDINWLTLTAPVVERGDQLRLLVESTLVTAPRRLEGSVHDAIVRQCGLSPSATYYALSIYDYGYPFQVRRGEELLLSRGVAGVEERKRVVCINGEWIGIPPGAPIVVGPLRNHQADAVVENVTLTARYRDLVVMEVRNGNRVKVRWNEADEPIPDNLKAGLLLRERQSGATEYQSSLGEITEAVIEEGDPRQVTRPLRTVIRLRGTHRDDQNRSFLKYTARLHFYAGKSYVRVVYTLENDGAYGYWAPSEHKHFASLDLVTSLNLQGIRRVSFERFSENPATGETYRLWQTHQWNNNLDQQQNFPFQVTKDGTRVVDERSYRANGFFQVADSQHGLTVAVKDFWQNFPKGITFRSTTLRLELWPQGGFGPTVLDRYLFEGGRHKIYECLYWFHPASVSRDEAEALVRAFQKPLFAIADPRYITDTGALGFPYVERRNWRADDRVPRTLPGDEKEFERYERMVKMLWDVNAADDGIIGRQSFITFMDRGRTYGGGQDYGWLDYGDQGWAEGRDADHYDWPFVFWQHFVRTGDYGFFELGRAFTRHRIDICQYHVRTGLGTESNFKGGQRYQKGLHGGLSPPLDTHSWYQGVLLAYALTGDMSALEAAQEAGEYFYRPCPPPPPGDGCDWGAQRGIGWGVQALTELYQYLGDPDYLRKARCMVNTALACESRYGGRGYFLNAAGPDPCCARPPNPNSPTCNRTEDNDPRCDWRNGQGICRGVSPWITGVLAHGLAKYYITQLERNVTETDVKDYVIRIAHWLATGSEMPSGPPLRGGEGPAENYLPLRSVVDWTPNCPQEPFMRAEDHIIPAFMVAPFTYAYRFGRDPDDAVTARQMFRDLVGYFGGGHWTMEYRRVNLNDQSHLSPITYRVSMFPNTETKVWAYLLRDHLVQYMATELEEDKPNPPQAPFGLEAVALSFNSIRLTWQDNATSPRSYRIERNTVSPRGPWQLVQYRLPDNRRDYLDRGLRASTTYWYRVAAVNLGGRTYSTNVAQATTHPPECTRGDLNNDGRIDVRDLQLLINMVQGLTPPNLCRGDLDENGQLTRTDVDVLADRIIRQ